MQATLSAMDVPRVKPKSRRTGSLAAAGALSAVALITVALSRLGTAAPSVKTEADEAARQAQATKQLASRGMVASQEEQRTEGKSAELARRLNLEAQRQAVLQRGLEAQLAAQREQLARLRAVAEFRRRQV